MNSLSSFIDPLFLIQRRMTMSLSVKEMERTSGTVFDDLREFIDACKEIDEWREIEGADWDQEMGALTEATAETIPEPPMLLFDRIKGYPAGYRAVSLFLASYKRFALALGLPVDKTRLELVRLAARKIKDVKPIPPVEVAKGPVMENIL